MRTKGELPYEPNHTSQATYFIARDTTTWSLSYIEVTLGKGSSISQVSINLSHGTKSKVDELDGWGQVTWNQSSTKVYNLYEHGIRNNLHIKFLD